MDELVTKGVFSGDVNGSELNIVSTTRVTANRVTIEHESTRPGKVVRDEITDPREVRVLSRLEFRRAQLSAAEAYRHRPVQPNWKPSRQGYSKQSATFCPDCDGSGWFDGDVCPACDGDGWRIV